MPTVRIDNLSNDSLIAELNGESYEVAEGEKLSVQNVQKGETTLRIRRSIRGLAPPSPWQDSG